MINKTKKSDFLKRLTVLATVFGVLLSLLSSVPFKKLNAQTENVLWIGPDANYAWFGQQVALEAGKKYEFSFYQTPGNNCYANIYRDLSEHGISSTKAEDGDYVKTTAYFTVPSDALDGKDGKKLVWVGIRTGEPRKQYEYCARFKLSAENAPEVNLLRDSQFEIKGEYDVDKSIWKSAYGDNITDNFWFRSISEIGGIEAFKRTDSRLNVLWMDSALNYEWFGQQVALEEGKEYEFSFYQTPGNNCYPVVYKDLRETPIQTVSRQVGSYNQTIAKFTVPSDALDGDNGKKLVWVGIRSAEPRSQYEYCAKFNLYALDAPQTNLLKDAGLTIVGSYDLNKDIWKNPYGAPLPYGFWVRNIGEIGGIEAFKRPYEINDSPKMMFYDRTQRGPDREAYGCFTLAFPSSVNRTGKNYIFEFSARASVGGVLDQFRVYSLDPAMYIDNEYSVKPTKIDGYRYSFNLRQDVNSEQDFAFMIFVPEGSKGHISYLSMYEADENFNKINDEDLLKYYYNTFEHYYKPNARVGLYALQGACQDTDTGRLDNMPEYYFDPSPDVPIPAGSKMMSYNAKWTVGQIKINLPYSVPKGSADGKNYLVSFYLKPTVGRDPSKYYTTGQQGDNIQIYPLDVTGYKYTFYIKETYDFKIILELPQGCRGNISRLEMYEADDDYNRINNINKATTFGKNGDFSDYTVQYGMGLPGITFTNGFTNTFIDTRKYRDELKNGKYVDYESTGALCLIPDGYFDTPDDTGWADIYLREYEEESGTVVGKLTNGHTVLSKKRVKLISMSDSSVLWETYTNGSGEFSFEKIPLGGYDIAVVLADGTEIPGDDTVWIDDDGDISEVSLIYTGDALLGIAKTGDSTAIISITVMALLSLAFIAPTIVYKKRGKKNGR